MSDTAGPVNYLNPFSVGAFRPVPGEVTATDLPVEGAIPPELDGLFVRNGFAPAPGAPVPSHLFMADGLLHGLRIAGGKPQWYRNRWVVTDTIAAARGLPAVKGPADIRWAPINPANTHFVQHAGRFLALCEIGLPYEMTSDLETVGRYDFGGRLKTNMTAHPRVDPVTGEMHFFAYGPRPPFAHYHRADATGALVHSQTVDVQGPTVMHDFALTTDYAVFFDLPLQFAPPGGKGLPFAWRQDLPARIGLLAYREADPRTRWFEIEPCFLAHTLNAFQGGTKVTIRGVARDVGYALGTRPPYEGEIFMKEWTVDVATGQVAVATLSDRRADFPRVDLRREGRAHRYGYAMEIPGTPDWAVRGNLFKYDLVTGAVTEHDLGAHSKASEPLFVAAHATAGEDEGWVLSYVHDQANESAYVVVLDAANFAAPAVAKIRLPQRVPYGAHGSWIAAAEL